jgi:hypothetical protein
MTAMSNVAAPPTAPCYRITGDELPALLDSFLTVEDFLHDYWGQRSIYIPGCAAKLKTLLQKSTFDIQDFRDGLLVPAGNGETVSAHGSESASDVQSVYYEQRNLAALPDLQAADRTIEDKGTLLTEGTGNSTLARFGAALKAQLRFAGELMVTQSYSGKDSGVPMHMDRSCVIVLQCEGSKRWLYSERPHLPWPAGTVAFAADGQPHYTDHDPSPWAEAACAAPGEVELREIVLSPGDVLILPAGALHSTSATSEYSISISFLFTPATFPDLLLAALRERLLASPAQRFVPALTGSGYWSGCVDEAREALSSSSVLEPELRHARAMAIAQPGERTLEAMSLDDCREVPPLQPRDKLTLSRSAPVLAARNSEGGYTLYRASQNVPMPRTWNSTLERAFQLRVFCALDLDPDALTTEDLLEGLQALRGAGFVELAGETESGPAIVRIG